MVTAVSQEHAAWIPYTVELLRTVGFLGVEQLHPAHLGAFPKPWVHTLVVLGEPPQSWLEAVTSSGTGVVVICGATEHASHELTDAVLTEASRLSRCYPNAGLRCKVPRRTLESAAHTVQLAAFGSAQTPAATVSGRVATVYYDLPRSVQFLRHGDPAKADQDTDGVPGIRPNDAFVDVADPSRRRIPLADLHLHLLTELIERVARYPAPRLWHLPSATKSMLIMTGDGDGAPVEHFERLLECVERYGGRITLYLMEETRVSKKRADQWARRGHSTSIHPYSHGSSVRAIYSDFLRHRDAFMSQGRLAPRTVRNHCLLWCGHVDMARVESELGLEMDFNCVTFRPLSDGYLFGSSLPMRFCDADGQVIDLYQQPTLFEDDIFLGPMDHSQSLPTEAAVSVLRDILSTNLHRDHSPIVMNVHPDNFVAFSGEWTEAALDFARKNHLPIWSAEEWLDFVKARRSITWQSIAAETTNGWHLSAMLVAKSSIREATFVLPHPERLEHVTLNGKTVATEAFTAYGGEYAAFTTDLKEGTELHMEVVYR